MTSAVLRSAQAGAILTAVGLSVGLMTGPAEAEPPPGVPPREHACLSPVFPNQQNVPLEWIDLNKRYGVKERIIGPPANATTTPPTPACRTAYLGERWVRAVPPWIMAPDKVAEFKERFVGARYVIDANPDGTGGQTVTVGAEVLQFGSVPEEPAGYAPGAPFWGGSSYAVPVSPVFDKLPVCDPDGSACHKSTLYVTMKEGAADVCNGLGANAPGLKTVPGHQPGCLPAVEAVPPDADNLSETEWPILDNGPFTVVKMPPPGRTP